MILTGMSPAERRDAYHADITYGTNNEFGFDYLQRQHGTRSMNSFSVGNFAIVDEVDSILIDEARTPLIIRPADSSSKWYAEFARHRAVAGQATSTTRSMRRRNRGRHR